VFQGVLRGEKKKKKKGGGGGEREIHASFSILQFFEDLERDIRDNAEGGKRKKRKKKPGDRRYSEKGERGESETGSVFHARQGRNGGKGGERERREGAARLLAKKKRPLGADVLALSPSWPERREKKERGKKKGNGESHEGAVTEKSGRDSRKQSAGMSFI